MTDVVEIAKARQARLTSEIGKLDNFISMAEALVKQSRSEPNTVSGTEDGNAADSPEDLSVRELSAGERV